MKDMVTVMQKARNVISVILINLFTCVILAQNSSFEEISDAEYEVINDFFDRGNDEINETVYIYYKTYSDKGWSIYFTYEDLNLITGNVGIPTAISDEELKKLLPKDVLRKFYNGIYDLQSCKISKTKIKPKISNIHLVKSFDTRKDFKKDVIRISKPIIVNDLAIFRVIRPNEAPIFFLKRENNEWKVIYASYEWLILE
jgi:hypothetical protein